MLPALQFYFRTVLNGEPLKENQHFFRARRVRFASAATVHYQIDGDPGGTLPVEIETLPNRLTLIVPPVGGPISVPTSRFVPNR